MAYKKYLPLLLLSMLMQSCSISYKFNGASIDYSKTKTIAIADFPNNAALVYPQLSPDLSQGIRDLFERQTRLILNRKGGDMEIEGEITGYALTPMAIAADSYSAENKLTVTIRVRFTNNINPEESFEKTYSAYQTFPATQMLSDVQEELCAIIIKELADNIYNDTVARW